MMDDLYSRRRAAIALLEGEAHDPFADTAAPVDDDGIYGADDLEIAATFRPGTTDELASKAALRHAKHEQADEQAKFVRINPVSVGKGTLGGQQTVAHGANAQVALWGGEEMETTAVTIAFAPVQQIAQIDPDGTVTGVAPYRPYGIVKFGTRAFLPDLEVDIGTGVVFTVPANVVSLQVALEAVPAGSGADPGTMPLMGTLSFLPGQKNTPITRTRYIDDGNATALVTIPPFAKRFWVYRDIASAMSVSVRDSSNTGIYGFNVAANALMTAPQILPGDAAYVLVTIAGAFTARVVFELGL